MYVTSNIYSRIYGIFTTLADIGQRYTFRLHVFEKIRAFYNKELSMDSSSTCVMHSKLLAFIITASTFDNNLTIKYLFQSRFMVPFVMVRDKNVQM